MLWYPVASTHSPDTHTESDRDRRLLADRRAAPTNLWWSLTLRGMRMWLRRKAERSQHYFVDRYRARVLILILLLLTLSIVDGVITLHLLDLGFTEINPLMRYLLSKGGTSFLIGKYALTATGLPFLVAYMHYPLFRSRFRVGYLLPFFVSLYLVLLGYQLGLLLAHNS